MSLSDIHSAYEKRCILCDIGRALLLAAVVFVFLMVMFAAAKAQDQTIISYWNHSTSPERGYSVMRMFQRQGKLYMEYAHPRQSLLNIGVVPGQIFFEGVLNGTTVVGRAAAFKPGCPIGWYNVKGTMMTPAILQLNGPAPQWDGCYVEGLSWDDKNANLLFYYREDLAPAPPVAVAPPPVVQPGVYRAPMNRERIY